MGLDMVGITETHLRDAVQIEGNEYVMIGKGRRKREKLGGDIALLHRKARNLRVEELDAGDSLESDSGVEFWFVCVYLGGKVVR